MREINIFIFVVIMWLTIWFTFWNMDWNAIEQEVVVYWVFIIALAFAWFVFNLTD